MVELPQDDRIRIDAIENASMREDLLRVVEGYIGDVNAAESPDKLKRIYDKTVTAVTATLRAHGGESFSPEANAINVYTGVRWTLRKARDARMAELNQPDQQPPLAA